MQKVSVVIPAYNEASYIDRLLKCLSAQNYDGFEVIVSDAESKDGTDKIVGSYKDRLDIKLVESPPQGPGAGRNVGAKQATGEWLMFLDADIKIDDPEFISKLVNQAEAKGWGTASTGYKSFNTSKLSRWWMDHVNQPYFQMFERTKHPVAPGFCILTKRKIFEEFNGFNPRIQLGEDYDYVSRAGGKYGFGFVREAVYWIDLRRANEEGFKLAWKGFKCEVYRLTHHFNVEGNNIAYEFGKHRENK